MGGRLEISALSQLPDESGTLSPYGIRGLELGPLRAPKFQSTHTTGYPPTIRRTLPPVC